MPPPYYPFKSLSSQRNKEAKKKHLISGSGGSGWGILVAKQLEPWGPFLESPGNFSGPKSNIQIEI